ncbi:MAG: hypothetical protein KAT85_11865 [candidate division Zixibacteria bacterium]|nr:hypothetical protein [candidate division Zixibacteria bacterium]
MSQIKKLPKKDIDEFLRIAVNAYPGMKVDTDEKMKKLRTRVRLYQRNGQIKPITPA